MRRLFHRAIRFLRDEEGPTAVEYAMMVMLVLLAVITAVTVLGQATATSLGESKDSIISATGH